MKMKLIVFIFVFLCGCSGYVEQEQTDLVTKSATNGTYILNTSPYPSQCSNSFSFKDVQLFFSTPLQAAAALRFSVEKCTKNANGSYSNFQRIVAPWNSLTVSSGTQSVILDVSCNHEDLMSFVPCGSETNPITGGYVTGHFRITFLGGTYLNTSTQFDYTPEFTNSIYIELRKKCW